MKNLHLHPSDETLMAYADGELDEDVALAMETAMASDPELIKELVGFTRSRRLARAAMSRGLEQASPELISAISAMARRPDTRPVEEKGIPVVHVSDLPLLDDRRGLVRGCPPRIRWWPRIFPGFVALG